MIRRLRPRGRARRPHPIRLGLTCLLVGLLWGCDNTTAAEHLARAQTYYAEDDASAAVIELKNALQKSPDMGQARLLLGGIYLQQGDIASALKELERALDLGQDEDVVFPYLLQAKLAMGRYQEVLGSLEELGYLPPELLVVKGSALFQGGDPEAAEAVFRQVLEQVPEQADALLGLARIAWAERDLDGAADYLARAVAADPGNRGALLTKAELHVQRRQFDEALAAYRAILDLRRSDVEARLGVARVELVKGNTEAAAAELESILERAPDYPPANYLQALLGFQLQDFEMAEAALLKVQRVAPDHVPSLFLLGAVKYHDEQFAQSRDLLGRYLSHDPRNVAARKLLAAMNLKEGDPERAIQDLQPVAADLDDPQGLALLGTALLQTGDLVAATEYLERAAAAAPDVAALRTQLALGLLATGERASAVAELEAAVEMDDGLIQSEMLLVLVHLRSGEFEQAVAGADAMIEARPEEPVGYNLRGAALIGLDRVDEGEASLRKALSVDPAYAPAATNLAQLALQRGDRDVARGLYDGLLAADPANLQAQLGLAELDVGDNERASALAHLETARLDHPDAFAPRLVLARIAVLTGDLNSADEYIEEAMLIAPGRIDVLLLAASIDIDLAQIDSARSRVDMLHVQLENQSAQAKTYLGLATMQQRLNQPDRARQNLQRTLELDAENSAAKAGLARLDIAAGDFDAARTALAALRETDWNPAMLELAEGDLARAEDRRGDATVHYRAAADAGNREAAMKLVDALVSEGDPSAASAAARGWLEEHPKDDGVRMLLAGALLQNSDASAAVAVYEELDERFDNPVVLNNLAWLYMDSGDERALETAREAYRLAPGNAEIGDTLGWILVQTGAPEEGLDHLQRAAQELPKNGSVLYHLAVAQRMDGDDNAARTNLEAAIATGVFPERNEAERALEELGE